MKIIIKGTGHCLPDNVVSNADIVSRLNSTAEFIKERTGVLTRRHVSVQEGLKDLAIPAIQNALDDANMSPQEIDMLIVNTLSPDHHDPSQACLLQSLLNFRDIPVFDIRAQCTGLLYGIDIASQFIASGKHSNILVVCGEILSKKMDYSNDGRNLSILLGDGAGAVILSNNKLEDNKGFIDLIIKADGAYYKLLWTEGPGSSNSEYNKGVLYSRMNGKAMFQHAKKKFVEISNEILSKHNLTFDDIDLIIPHQPNLRLLEAVVEDLGVKKEKVIINVDSLGNMASASLPVTLSIARKKGFLKDSDLCLIVGYGSGATWGAALYQN